MQKSKKVVLIGLDGANPQLLKSYVEQGALRHIASLMQRGIFAHNLPSIPANTTVNWATIATGANPGTHGITDFWVHFPGDPLDKFHDAFDSRLLQAEPVWNTADSAGRRVVVMNYPLAHPPSMQQGIFVGGEGSPYSGSLFEIRSASCFASKGASHSVQRATIVDFDKSGAMLCGKFTLTPNKGVDSSGVEYNVHLVCSQGQEYDRVEVLNQEGILIVALQQKQWSEWLSGRFIVDGEERKGWFRFYLTELSPDGERFKLYTSQVFPEEGYTVPNEVGQELLELAGPYLEYCGAGPYRRGWHDIQAWFDEMRYKGLWMAKAGSHLINKYDAHLFYSHFHALDHVFHYLWGGFDPLTGWYDPEKSSDYEAWMLAAHKIADDMVGIFLDEIGDDATYVIVSDHGLIPHIKSISINNLLAQAGLISWHPGPDHKPIVDWSKTVGYKPTDAAHIWINLEGRDPEGIVKETDYEVVQERIIDVLLSLRDPEDGRRPVALALKKRDATLLGLWGERVGDVIFLTEPEYSAMLGAPLSNDGRVIVRMGPEEEGIDGFHAPDFQSYHGCALPTAQLGRGGSEAGMFLIAGPGIKQGIELKTPIRAIDIAPTIAHLLDIPQPAQAEGQILQVL